MCSRLNTSIVRATAIWPTILVVRLPRKNAHFSISKTRRPPDLLRLCPRAYCVHRDPVGPDGALKTEVINKNHTMRPWEIHGRQSERAKNPAAVRLHGVSYRQSKCFRESWRRAVSADDADCGFRFSPQFISLARHTSHIVRTVKYFRFYSWTYSLVAQVAYSHDAVFSVEVMKKFTQYETKNESFFIR